MQPYLCATTTVTPAGRTALCPLRSILGAIGHLDKTKDLSAFPAGQDEPRSASRPMRGSGAEGSLFRQIKLFLPAGTTLPRIPRISRTISVGGTHLTTHTTHITHHFRRRDAPYHAYHAYHAPFPSAGRTLPRIPRISRTISVGGTHLTTHTTHITHHFRRPGAPYHAYHAYHAPFPSAWRTLPRIPRISRTISVGLLRAHEIRFPNSSRRTTQVFLESPTLMLCIRRPQRSGL